MKALFIAAALALLAVAACAKVAQTQPAQQAAAQAGQQVQQADIDKIQADIVAIDAADQNLNLTELNSLDQDLNFG